MRRTIILGLAAGLALAGGMPADAEAQGRGKGRIEQRDRQERQREEKRGRAEERRDGRTLADILRGRGTDRHDNRDDDRDEARRRGPKFCQNGQGHPVHGRRWCQEKGFGLGNGLGSLGDIRWEERRWDDIVYRTPRSRDGALDRGGLLDVLGSVILDRFDAQARALGSADALSGRWLEGREGPLVLWLQAGRTPVAQLLDMDRDGRVDRVRLNGGR